MERVIRMALAITVVSIAFASPASATEQWVVGNLWHVYPEANGAFIITFQGTQSAACTSVSNPKYFNVEAGQYGVNADGVKAMLATALTAIASGKVIEAAFDDSTSNCFVNRLRIVN